MVCEASIYWEEFCAAFVQIRRNKNVQSEEGNVHYKKEDIKMRKNNKIAVNLNRVRLYLVFWAFLVIVFSAVIFIQVRKHAALSANIESLTQQINDASAQQIKLQQQIDSKSSDKAIEDYAHNQLGLVYPNEIIIYNDNYKN